MWQEPKTHWTPEDPVGPSTFERIEGNVEVLGDRTAWRLDQGDFQLVYEVDGSPREAPTLPTTVWAFSVPVTGWCRMDFDYETAVVGTTAGILFGTPNGLFNAVLHASSVQGTWDENRIWVVAGDVVTIQVYAAAEGLILHPPKIYARTSQAPTLVDQPRIGLSAEGAGVNSIRNQLGWVREMWTDTPPHPLPQIPMLNVALSRAVNYTADGHLWEVRPPYSGRLNLTMDFRTTDSRFTAFKVYCLNDTTKERSESLEMSAASTWQQLHILTPNFLRRDCLYIGLNITQGLYVDLQLVRFFGAEAWPRFDWSVEVYTDDGPDQQSSPGGGAVVAGGGATDGPSD